MLSVCCRVCVLKVCDECAMTTRLHVCTLTQVMHGRDAFRGGRYFLGCYTGHDELESRMRLELPASEE